ncbi:MAG: L-proline glycine betaine binding transporter protein ProX [Labilithrix sp.]|nr:L-proline glycine betaine binding transporter protein ProX [Labilithrix sp.]
MKQALVTALLVLMSLAVTRTASAKDGATMRVGSKRFVESYILAEMVAQLAREGGASVEHDQGLGGTAVVFRAIEDGSIDVYPEYTGTLAAATVKTGASDLAALRAALAPRGLAISDPLGFENTYALAVSRSVATKLGLTKVSDLVGHPDLRVAMSHEFLGRRDGWPGLAERYGLAFAAPPKAIDHALAYEAISRGESDVIDVYTTDAKIGRFDLVVLADDRRFFPPYDAVLVYRADLPARVPAFAKVLERLRGAIDATSMQKMNARAELDGVPFARVAADFLAKRAGSAGDRVGLLAGTLDVVKRHGPRHLMLVAVSLAMSIAVGVPLGILAYARRRVGAAVLGLAGVVQTIPSLALFCFFIPLFGIGPVPALAALFVYGLLPIVRNTHAGLVSIPADLRDSAIAIGLSPSERLRHVELPLASRTILAGIKTSAVVAVGSATIAAFIGAGGFGEPISTGLSLNDVTMIMEGAIPAAAMALLVEGAFVVIERAVVPRGLRESREV